MESSGTSIEGKGKELNVNYDVSEESIDALVEEFFEGAHVDWLSYELWEPSKEKESGEILQGVQGKSAKVVRTKKVDHRRLADLKNKNYKTKFEKAHEQEKVRKIKFNNASPKSEEKSDRDRI